MYASCVVAGAVAGGGGCALRGFCEGGGGCGVFCAVCGCDCDCALLGVCALWFVDGFARVASVPLGLPLPLLPLLVTLMSSIVYLIVVIDLFEETIGVDSKLRRDGKMKDKIVPSASRSTFALGSV